MSLAIEQQIDTASRMALRAHVHFDLWWLTASQEGRSRHPAIGEHWEHLRFLQHGQLAGVVGEIHALLDDDKRTICLPAILRELERQRHIQLPEVARNLKAARPAFRKLQLLRNNVFAHRTAKKTYEDMFKDANIRIDQLKALIALCIGLTNELLGAIGEPFRDPSPLPGEHYAKMLDQLKVPRGAFTPDELDKWLDGAK